MTCFEQSQWRSAIQSPALDIPARPGLNVTVTLTLCFSVV